MQRPSHLGSNVIQEHDYGHDDYLRLGDESADRTEHVDVWGVQWE